MNKKVRLNLHIEKWSLNKPFRLNNYCYEAFEVVVAELAKGEVTGRGEAKGVRYLGETPESIIKQIETIADQIEGGATRNELLYLLPPGGARNAIDCALWDLEAKLTGKSIWELTGMPPRKTTTMLTIGIEDTPEKMAMSALKAANYPALKVKLDGNCPVENVRAIRSVRPDARLVVDANQAWSFNQLKDMVSALEELGVEMIEQPMPRGGDEALENYLAPIPLCADESCLYSGELDLVTNRYQMINIKLDKTGGLTEALLLARAAQKSGLKLMVGNMGGTSLCIAPGLVIASLCQYVDLDGHLLLKYDRSQKATQLGGEFLEVSSSLWG